MAPAATFASKDGVINKPRCEYEAFDLRLHMYVGWTPYYNLNGEYIGHKRDTLGFVRADGYAVRTYDELR